ncbi:hypothetical protein [Borrelia miyamotoi]|uniref:Uncharacterized protein n=1 Tax=Borrelia miyamotoi TaxID=47466 RepID=A0AAQ3HFU3_9SPIR|nr:hypothetical protein [Borrelia miyamotoi]WEG86192.1 hypothetical protein EZU67_007460 [Borrelia miyamotoi]
MLIISFIEELLLLGGVAECNKSILKQNIRSRRLISSLEEEVILKALTKSLEFIASNLEDLGAQ